MLIRIVKMTFRNDEVENFLKIFEEAKTKIRNFEGCIYLELWQDKTHSNILFTHSHWLNENDLENYRQSALFANTWNRTKILFADKPETWSVAALAILD